MLYHTCCIEGAKTHIQTDSVDLFIADPPFNLRFGGTTQTKTKKPRFEVFENDNLTPAAYKQFCMQWMAQAYRILKPGHHAYIFIDWRMYADMVHWLRLIGFVVKNCIVWDKQHMGLGWQYRFQHELIIFAVKPAKRNRRINTRKDTDIWRIPRIHGNKTIHPTEKPVELLKRIILNSTDEGAEMVDFFSGSGVASEAAILTRRNYKAFEIGEHWYQVSKARIDAAEQSLSQE
ncbi:site-specific DNA-methyltransferase [Paenibacillus algorifonticola]|uniref:DNA-methyltransferase n=1 Tax=Paenibacillus algorifonticola TaxID=684063 RepID=UPI003D2D952F